jgi:hypothetical protein
MPTLLVLLALAAIALVTAGGLARWLWRQTQPRLCQATLLAVLDVYKRAWEQQDAALILTIFRPDAVYHERVLREPIRGYEGIAEWGVSFDDVAQHQREHWQEIAVLEFVDGKIAPLRKCWASEVIREL